MRFHPTVFGPFYCFNVILVRNFFLINQTHNQGENAVLENCAFYMGITGDVGQVEWVHWKFKRIGFIFDFDLKFGFLLRLHCTVQVGRNYLYWKIVAVKNLLRLEDLTSRHTKVPTCGSVSFSNLQLKTRALRL